MLELQKVAIRLSIMKYFILSALFAASSYASPLLAERQTCPSSGITVARSAEVLNKFRSARVIPDSVPEFTPTTELRVRYGNINENLGNEFNVLRMVGPQSHCAQLAYLTYTRNPPRTYLLL